MRSETQIFRNDQLAGHKVKIAVAILAGAYFLWAAAHPDDWRLIDGVNLVIHEAGHLFFRPLGEFMMIAGGSLFQVIVPLIFAGYFFFNGKHYAGALVLFWVGESLLNVSVYAADSVVMQLPLLGGNDSVHDWNYMLEHLDLLHKTATIAWAIRALGTLFILGALVGGILTARLSPRARGDEAWKNF